MKTIGKKELLELIKTIPSRSYEEKPILIYQTWHSGPDLYIGLLWHKQYISSYVSIPFPLNSCLPWYDSDECKFFEAYMLRFEHDFAEWCIQWQQEKKKPAIILLEKSTKYFDEKGNVTGPGMGQKKTLSIPEFVGEEEFLFIDSNFDVYIYDVDEELNVHPPMGRLAHYTEEKINEMKQEFGL